MTRRSPGSLANGLDEGGFNQPWQKSGGNENSFGHWQFNDNGELPGYQTFLKSSGLQNDTRSQALYVAQRMEQLYPGFSKITDPKQATDLVGTLFEKYQGAAPGQRDWLIPNAQKIMAGDYSGGLGARGHTGAGAGTGTGVGTGSAGTGGIGATQPAADTSATATQGGIGNQVAAISGKALENTPPEQRSGLSAWMHSPYYLAFLAGAGMLASRSPFPGVALGQGLEGAAKGMQTEQSQDYKNQIAEQRAQNLAQQANNAYEKLTLAQSLGTQRAGLMTQHYTDLASHYQDMSVNYTAQADAAKAKLDLAGNELDRKRLADQLNFTAKMALATKPPPQLAVLQSLMAEPGGPPTIEAAMALQKQAQSDPQAKAKLDLAINKDAEGRTKLEEQAFIANPANTGRSFDSRGSLERNMQAARESIYGAGVQQPTQAAPTTSATAAPAAKPAAPASPTEVIQNGWRYRQEGSQYVPVGPVQ